MNTFSGSFFEFVGEVNGEEMIRNIERCGRICYKSKSANTVETAKDFIKRVVIGTGHETLIEHEKVTVIIVCDRGVTHAIVRHRLASFSQESTQYCNYAKEKFGKTLTFIEPPFLSRCSEEVKKIWINTMMEAEKNYLKLIELGLKAEQARTILPTSLKTELVVTANLREWRHIFKLRTSKKDQEQIREVFCPMLDEFKKRIPVVFDDINYNG